MAAAMKEAQGIQGPADLSRKSKVDAVNTVPRYLLTGKPGVGKTTLIRKVADGLWNVSLGGFLTQEIRERGRRVGFRVETFDGRSGILAHVDLGTGPRVGKYRVDCDAFNRIGVHALEQASTEADVLLIDEIGKMELFSARFRAALSAAFDVQKSLVATIMAHGHPLTDAIKKRSDIRLIEVTVENRNRLATEIGRALRLFIGPNHDCD